MASSPLEAVHYTLRYEHLRDALAATVSRERKQPSRLRLDRGHCSGGAGSRWFSEPGDRLRKEDPYGAFLPPPVLVDSEGTAPFLRAVVFVTDSTKKGSPRAAQEYQHPLFVLTGQDYSRATFTELHERICEALRSRKKHATAVSPTKPGRRVSCRWQKLHRD